MGLKAKLDSKGMSWPNKRYIFKVLDLIIRLQMEEGEKKMQQMLQNKWDWCNKLIVSLFYCNGK